MSKLSLTPAERRQLLQRCEELRENQKPGREEAFTMPQLQAMVEERNALLQEYGERLPFVPISRCPICVETLEYPMDIQGLDGPWWFKGPLADYPPPHACRHFRVLLGAMDFKSLQPTEATVNKEVLTGPAVPFVVPRLLTEIPNMKAVISSFQMPPGYTCYPIAYFSEKPVHGSLLHQSWGRQAYQVLDEDGKYLGWNSANDKWDFDLQPWIDKGQLLWINPSDPNLTLHNRPPCPYVNLPGVRAPQVIKRGKIEVRPLPTGEKLQPFE